LEDNLREALPKTANVGFMSRAKLIDVCSDAFEVDAVVEI
jgi:hypothetical protein